MLPFEYRLTKYDPDQRDDRGAFIGDDWISVSDVGSVFDGRRLTLARYLEVEAAHLAVVAAFMTEAEVDGLIVVGLEQRRERPLSVELVNGRKLTALEVTDTLRHLLREDAWCRLEAAERFYVHVGWDYYMYLGCDRRTPASVEYARTSELHLDHDFPSPHWPEEEDG